MSDNENTTRAYELPADTGYDVVGGADDVSLAPLAVDAGMTDEAAEIRGEIEQTRTELSETINAIQDKLNPQTLMDQAKETVRDTATGMVEQAKETVRDATIGKAEQMVSDVGETARGTGSSIVETIRQNPVPAALAAIGVGWLWMNRSKGTSAGNGSYQTYRPSSSSRASGSYGTAQPSYGASGTYGTAQPSYQSSGAYQTAPAYQTVRRGDSTGSGGQGMQGTVRDTVNQAQDTAGQLVNQAQDTAGHLVNQAQDTAGQLVDQAQSGVSQLAGQAQSGVSTLVEGTQQQAQRAQGQLQQMMQETPLAAAGIAFALGTAVGLAIPETRPEHQLMGEARDTVMQKAQSTAEDAMHKVQDVAQKVGSVAVDTAKSEAQNQGLAPR